MLSVRWEGRRERGGRGFIADNNMHCFSVDCLRVDIVDGSIFGVEVCDALLDLHEGLYIVYLAKILR